MELRRSLLMVFICSLLFLILSYSCFEYFFVNHELSKEITLVIVSAYMWIPGLCALFLMNKEKIKIRIFARLGPSFIYAIMLPLAIVTLGIVLSMLFAPCTLDRILSAGKAYHINTRYPFLNFSIFIISLYFISLISSLTLNFFFSLGEELFWRGYLWEKMKCLGFWRGSFNIGLLWALWYAPLVIFFGYNYPKNSFLGVLLMGAFFVVITPILIFLREGEKSVMSATIFHSMMNAFCPIAVVFFPEGNHFLIAPLGIAGVLSTGIVCLVFVYSRKKVLIKAV